MKYTIFSIILIYTNISMAAVKIEMSLGEGFAKQATSTQSTEAEAKTEMIQILERSKTLKHSWKDQDTGFGVIREIKDIEGNNKTQYLKPENFTFEIKNMDAEIEAAAYEAAVAKKLDCGQRSLKYISIKNAKKGLNSGQIKKMAKDYSLINDLLRSGAIDTAIEEISAMTPDGSVLTPQDKTEILAFVNGCNN